MQKVSVINFVGFLKMLISIRYIYIIYINSTVCVIKLCHNKS